MKDVTQISISIDNIELEHIIPNPTLILEKLQDNGELNTLKDYLFDTLSNKEAGPMYTNLKLKNFSYNPESNKGKFRITFDIERTYCCSDMESCHSDYIDFDFQINDNTLHGHAKYLNWELNN